MNLRLVSSPVLATKMDARHDMAETVTWDGEHVGAIYQMQGESFI